MRLVVKNTVPRISESNPACRSIDYAFINMSTSNCWPSGKYTRETNMKNLEAREIQCEIDIILLREELEKIKQEIKEKKEKKFYKALDWIKTILN